MRYIYYSTDDTKRFFYVEEIDDCTDEEANDSAYEAACQEFDNYGEYLEDDYDTERENTIEYGVIPATNRKEVQEWVNEQGMVYHYYYSWEE